MVDHGDEVGLERLDLGLGRRLAAQHAQDVGRVRQPRIGRQRLGAGLAAHHRGGEHRRRGDQAQRGRQVVAVGEARGERAHRLHRRQRQQGGVQRRDVGEHLGARRADRRRQIGRQVVEEAVQQQPRGLLVGRVARQLLDRAATDHQTAGLAIDLRKHGFGGDDVFEAVNAIDQCNSP